MRRRGGSDRAARVVGGALAVARPDPRVGRAAPLSADPAAGRPARPYGPLSGRARPWHLALAPALLQFPLGADRQPRRRPAGHAARPVDRARAGGEADRSGHPPADRCRFPVGRARSASPSAAHRLFRDPLRLLAPFMFGFVNFALSMALAFLAFGLWLRLARLGTAAAARRCCSCRSRSWSSSPTPSAGERSASFASRRKRSASTIAGSAGSGRRPGRAPRLGNGAADRDHARLAQRDARRR